MTDITSEISSESTPIPAPLIPRQVLFSNPDRAQVTISPDGKHLAFLAPDQGVLNVFVAPRGSPDEARAVTADRHRGVRQYFWCHASQSILFLQDTDGDENYHIFRVPIDEVGGKDLTPIEGAKVLVYGVSHRRPNSMLIGLNDRDPALHDVYKLDITTGNRELVMINDLGFVGFVVDEDLRIRLGLRFQEDGSHEYLRYSGDSWETWFAVPADDTLTTHPVGFDATGRHLYLVDSRGRDTGALVMIDADAEPVDSSHETVIYHEPRADVDGILFHPTENTVHAVSHDYERSHWTVLDPAVAADFAVLGDVAPGDAQVVSQSLDDRTWVVAFLMADGPVRYYLYDRDNRTATFLFTNRKALEGLPLVAMHPVVLPSRDGLNLVCYLSIPRGEVVESADGVPRPREPVGMVLLVHGGPWARDSWGFSPLHQLLANRGYAVLSVNFRGSTGFGKGFLNAGNKEWGARMHEDLLDAVEWAVQEGIALRDRVAIMGGSYGGYATLVGLAFTPDVFACGVDIVGPSNIVTLIETIPPYWRPMVKIFHDRVGNPETEEGRAFLTSRSPLSKAGDIKRPLLIAQGANDPRVKQTESDQIVKSMKEKSIPVTYVLYPDEGHGFARPENQIAFYAVTETFLAARLGGRAEPLEAAFEGSSITVPEGAEHVPGLSGR